MNVTKILSKCVAVRTTIIYQIDKLLPLKIVTPYSFSVGYIQLKAPFIANKTPIITEPI